MSSKNSRKSKAFQKPSLPPGPKPEKPLAAIASSTLQAIETGSFELKGETHDLKAATEYSKEHATFYAADDTELTSWRSRAARADSGEGSSSPEKETEIKIILASTLEATRNLYHELSQISSSEHSASTSTTSPPLSHPPPAKVAILNFASAKNPGGGFLTGAQAQEESLARSSTLYPSLLTPASQTFYISHKRDPRHGSYSDAMIYVPQVLFFRNDSGEWMRPVSADVLVSAAVNAGVVRRDNGHSDATEDKIAEEMFERMARVLKLFETQGAKDIVLGSFGTGVFRNNVSTIASNWARLLIAPKGRFSKSFDRVVFAIKDKKTFDTFKASFGRRTSV